jgi:methyl-accepting chemotaxis protein
LLDKWLSDLAGLRPNFRWVVYGQGRLPCGVNGFKVKTEQQQKDWLMALSFKQRIIGSMMGVGLTPLLAISALSLYLTYNTSYRDNLRGLGTVQRQFVARAETLYDTMRLQVQNAGVDQAFHMALKDFTAAVNNLDASTVTTDAVRLRATYTELQQKAVVQIEDIDALIPKDPTALALQSEYIAANPNPVGEKDKLNASPDANDYAVVHKRFHPTIRDFLEDFGYYDVFLVDAASGRVVYSEAKEVDFLSSVKTGPLVNTPFSQLVRKALASNEAGSVFISDMAPYIPNGGEESQFMASPIVENGKTLGAVVFEIPVKKLNDMFSGLKQLGETADGFVLGSDMVLRSNQMTEDGKAGEKLVGNVRERLKNLVARRYDGELEFRGRDGLSRVGSIRALKIEGLDWFALVGQGKAEMLAGFWRQLYIQSAIIVLATMLTIVIGFIISRMLVQPVVSLSRSFGVSAEKVGRATSQVGDAVSSMVAASEETSRQTTVVRKNSTEASGFVSSVSSSVDELNISINDISKSISDTNTVIDDAVSKAHATNEVVHNLGEATAKISDVVNLINDLSEQTSLLALNAAIEAARAGDAGRGFAVVADEVKKLANHTAEATAGIAEQVRTIQQVSEQSVESLETVVQAIHRIRDNATTVSAAVEEQSGVVKQIAGNVHDAASRVQQVEENMNGIEQAANDSGVASDQVSGSSNEVQGAFNELKSNVEAVLEEMGVKS